MTIRTLTPAALAVCAALTTFATTPVARAASFTSFWALGDSLTDDGNLYALTGGALPESPPYYEGRFSNGPVWAEHVAAGFAAKGLANDNYAYGGARALPDPAVPVPDLATQIGLFAAGSAGKLGARPVVSIWMGANDQIGNGIPNGDAARIGRQSARAVGAGARALAGFGVKDVLLFNLPNLGEVPAYALPPDPLARERATRGSAAFNRTLDFQIAQTERAGINVIEFDTAGLFQALLDDPQSFGVANATIPCYVPDSGLPACPDVLAPLLAFFDPVHPNSVIHAAIADRVMADLAAAEGSLAATAGGQVAPVPAPLPAALLLAAIAALGIARRRAT